MTVMYFKRSMRSAIRRPLRHNGNKPIVSSSAITDAVKETGELPPDGRR